MGGGCSPFSTAADESGRDFHRRAFQGLQGYQLARSPTRRQYRTIVASPTLEKTVARKAVVRSSGTARFPRRERERARSPGRATPIGRKLLSALTREGH